EYFCTVGSVLVGCFVPCPNRHRLAEDVELSDYCSVLVLDFCSVSLFARNSQTDIPNKNIEFGILKGKKDLCASRRLVDYSLKSDILCNLDRSCFHCVLS